MSLSDKEWELYDAGVRVVSEVGQHYVDSTGTLRWTDPDMDQAVQRALLEAEEAP